MSILTATFGTARCEALPDTVTEESRWVILAAEGDGDAILRLLSRHRPPIVRLLTGMTGDWASAEDLAQESFLQAFRRLDQLRDVTAFYPWVRRLAMRLALRSLRGRREISSEQATEPEAPDSIASTETRLAVHAVLADLAPDLRAALVLRELEGLDYAEIAAALDIPIGTVRSRLFTARERFRVLWLRMENES